MDVLQQGAGFFSPEAMEKDYRRYIQLGHHRTAGPGDLAGLDWLSGELAAAGFQVERPEFPLVQFSLRRSFFSVAGRPVECFPLWPPRPTKGAIHAPLELFDPQDTSRLAGCVVLAQVNDNAFHPAANHAAMIEAAQKAGAQALVIHHDNKSGLVAAHNVHAPFNKTPLDLPVLVIGHAQAQALAGLEGAEAELAIEGRLDESALGANVTARLGGGRGKGLVLTTPRTGWFACGAERGPGITVFLALARWLGALRPDMDITCAAFGGHELEFLGGQAFLADPGTPRPGQTACWLHLGAGVRCHGFVQREGRLAPQGLSPASRVMHSPELAAPLAEAFADLPDYRFMTTDGVGEGELARQAGYVGFSLASRQPHFHTPHDDGAMSSPGILAPVAVALAGALGSILGL